MNKIMLVAAMAAGLTACQNKGTGEANTADATGAEATADAPDAEGVDYAAIANRIVTESAGVKPGEVVVINGSPVEPKLLEALEAAVLNAGGHPIISLSYPRARKQFLTQAPAQYLSQPSKAGLALIQAGDVFISANGVDDPMLFADVDEERLNASREANRTLNDAATQKRGRSVDIGQSGGIPTMAYAKSRGADYKDMRAMFFKALAVPAATIAQRGAAVAARMKPGQQVRLRSASGTDVTLTLAANAPRVSTGRAADNDTGKGLAAAFLPAGDFYACVDPASANGVVVSPTETFRGRKIRNLRITFKGGAVQSITADEGAEQINAYFAQLDDDSKKFSLLNIGLNPESRPLKGSDYISWEMSGVPTVQVGNSQWAGCATGGEGGFSVHQLGATLSAGDAEVIKDGALATN